jgi:cytochrome c oxidase subunit 4
MSDPASGEHPHVNYFGIWWWLLILTVGEVGVVYVIPNRVVLAITLVLFALVKAVLVAAYFMHLKFEKKTMWIVALAPLIFASILSIGLVPDSDTGAKNAVQHSAPDEE